jgi:hypothetical protein
MTKEDLKQLIYEVYEEEMAETKKKGAAKAEPTKEAPKAVKAVKKVVAPAKKVVAVSKKVEEPTNKVTKNLVHHIEKREKSNKFTGDKADADLFDKVGKMLKRHVGRTLEESDVEKMMEEMECEECYEEGAKPDFLDLDKDGNKKEPMKKAAMDAKTSKKLKEIIEKAKNI